MTHLSREELQRWWEKGPPEDRERIVGHLAVCDECVRLYGEVMDERPPERVAEAVARDLIAAGHAAYQRVSAPARRHHPLAQPRWFLPLGAAAAIVVAAALYPLLRSPAPLVPPVDEAVRSTTIQLVSPAGTVTAPFAFAWTSPLEAKEYDVVVYDGTGRRVWSARAPGTRLEAPAELLQRLPPGVEHAWEVTAINPRGERSIQSPRQRFVVLPRAP